MATPAGNTIDPSEGPTWARRPVPATAWATVCRPAWQVQVDVDGNATPDLFIDLMGPGAPLMASGFGF